VLAEQNVLGNAGKQLSKDTPPLRLQKKKLLKRRSCYPDTVKFQLIERMVKSAPDALKGKAQNIATESLSKS